MKSFREDSLGVAHGGSAKNTTGRKGTSRRLGNDANHPLAKGAAI